MSVALTQPRIESVDFDKIRGDFPILGQSIRGKRLVYLDNAATSQKPKAVIEAVKKYYESDNANIHRGVHLLSERATELHEAAREKARAFLNAEETAEIVFCRGATEAINLVAQTFGRANLKEGDEVIISALEHHSNIVPWQMICQQTGAKLKVIPMNDRGELVLEDYEKLLNGRAKLVSVIHVSNALGTVNPVKAMIAKAHDRGIPVLLDGAQSAPHMKIDVKDLDCDFFAFSGHKTCGPTGIGVLYGKRAFLEKMPPYQGGGDMIRMVSFEKTLYNDIPFKFEAGTPHIAGAIGLGAAIDYLQAIGMDRIAAREAQLLAYATEKLSKVKGVRLIGTAREKAGVISFMLGRSSDELASRENAGGSGGGRSDLPLDDIHPHDIGTILDQEGIAIRTGHHCAMPIMERLNIPATARASLAFYNTKEDIDALVEGLEKVKAIFQ